MTGRERDELLDDEWLIVRHSGEIPEITYHSSLYYLSQDVEGPRLQLLETELSRLKDAAMQRYQEIVLRDINLDNFHKSIYRGLRRTLYNWQRLKMFAKRQALDYVGFDAVVAEELLTFLRLGVATAGRDVPDNFINCREGQLLEFVTELGIETQQLPREIGRFCLYYSENI